MTRQEVQTTIEEADGHLWCIPPESRLSVLGTVLTQGIDGLDAILPRSFIDSFNNKQRYGLPQDIVSIYVDWIAGHLAEGQRPAFDLSLRNVPDDMPKVALISPVYRFEESSIGLVRIAFFLRGLGIPADWIVASDKSADRIPEQCVHAGYDIIGQGATHYTFRADIALVHDIADVTHRCEFILGGHGAVLPPEERAKLLRTTPISVIVRGFGERSTARLALGAVPGLPDEAIHTREHVPGIYFENAEGRVIDTGVDSYTQLELRVLHAIFDPSLYPVEGGLTRLVTSTHCPFACSFCSSTHFPEQSPRRLPPEDVLDTVREIRTHHPGLRKVEFNDDNFSGGYWSNGEPKQGKKWLQTLSHATRKTDFAGVSSFCFTRADTIDDETLALLRDHLNLRKIGIGLEHVAPQVLRKMHRALPAERVVSRIRAALRLGVGVDFFIILFSKWETRDTLLELLSTTIALCLEGAQVVYNWGIQPLWGADVSNDATNRYIEEEFCIGDYQGFYRGKIIPDDPFTAKWFVRMNSDSDAYFDLQDKLSSRFLTAREGKRLDEESLWFERILRPSRNINRSNTLTNLVRFHAMFTFGARFVDPECEYFREGQRRTIAGLLNYLYNGPTYPYGGMSSIELKTTFLESELPPKLCEDPLASTVAELEVIAAGLDTPDFPGVHLGRHAHATWAKTRFAGWRAELSEDERERPDRMARQRVQVLMEKIEGLLCD